MHDGIMRGTTRHALAFALICASACGTGDTTVDPGDLELRDLLGVAPDVASEWDADQRASARRVLLDALDVQRAPTEIEAVQAPSPDERVSRSLAALDARRFANGDGALALVRVELHGDELTAVPRIAPMLAATAGGAPAPTLVLDTAAWDALTPRAAEILAAAAADAGHRDGMLVVVPSPRLAVIASYVSAQPPRLLVNPVLVASVDPAFVDLGTGAARQAAPSGGVTPATRPVVQAGGNPYSFYGSVAECAYAQRLRCEACLPSSNCDPVTTANGNDECTRLAENDGRGYFLLCINLSLAITSVHQCAEDEAPSCPGNGDVASDLGELERNARFLDDMACASGLDSCLAKIYGEPTEPFPGVVDGGMPPPPSNPPRDTNIDCGDSCSDNNSNCEASPSCSCDGPSCNNSFSCDSTCSSSNNQSGCGDNCDSCSSDDDGGGGGGGGGGGCSSDSGGSSSSGGGCGGDGGCGDSNCGGDSGCGGDGGCGGDSSCGGGGNGCQVTRRTPSAGFALALSLVWGALPIPLAAFARRRARRKAAGTKEDAR